MDLFWSQAVVTRSRRISLPGVSWSCLITAQEAYTLRWALRLTYIRRTFRKVCGERRLPVKLLPSSTLRPLLAARLNHVISDIFLPVFGKKDMKGSLHRLVFPSQKTSAHDGGICHDSGICRADYACHTRTHRTQSILESKNAKRIFRSLTNGGWRVSLLVQPISIFIVSTLNSACLPSADVRNQPQFLAGQSARCTSVKKEILLNEATPDVYVVLMCM